MSLNLALSNELLKFAAAGALLSVSSPAFSIPVPGSEEIRAYQLYLERGLTPLEVHAKGGGLSCHSITAEEFQKFSGWSKIAKYAEENWGTSNANYGANPSEYPNSYLRACTKGLPVTFSEKPECSPVTIDLGGTSTGTDSGIEYTVTRGFTQSSSWTVTDSSSLTLGAKFSISVSVPGITDVAAETSVSTTITNERFTSCSVKQVTNTCKATAKGDALIVAEGYFWFFFHEVREKKDRPDLGSHYHWNVKIANVLTEQERTTHMKF
ncbi:hypothetical protein BKA70DRAFT_1224398 [Coprinopsis sp. MPI-PUGE-AT-0042]|nr:hypothetical protein BKA70DRAFT_1224398 [Coprinopsis sp. MPI-PUGE-AT-0042]